MEVNNVLAEVDEIKTGIDDVNKAVFTSKQCLKTEDRIYKNLLKGNKTTKRENQLLREENSVLKDNAENTAQTYNNLYIMLHSLKEANTEMTCEILNIQEWRMHKVKQMQNIDRKYEKLWLETTNEWNDLRHYRKFLEVQNKSKESDGKLQSLKETMDSLKVSIISKKRLLAQENQERIINFARFMVQERPKDLNLIKTIQENNRKLNIEIEKLKRANDDSSKDPHSTTIMTVCETRDIITKTYEWPAIPKIKINVNDNEAFKFPLNTLEIDENPDKTNMTWTPTFLSEIFEITPSRDNNKPPKHEWDDYYASRYLSNIKIKKAPSVVPVSTEKQINLLDSKRVDEKEVHSIITSIDHKKLKPVGMIGLNCLTKQLSLNEAMEPSQKNMNIPVSRQPMKITEIIEMDESPHILIPPTQFRDLTEQNTHHTEKLTADNENLKKADGRKRVAFDVTEKLEGLNDSVMEQEDPSSNVENAKLGVNLYDSEVRAIDAKKKKRDSSPDFVYVKNDWKKKTDEKVVTSKFFINPENVNIPEKNTNAPMKDNTVANDQGSHNIQSTSKIDTVAGDKSSVTPNHPHFVSHDVNLSPESDASMDSPMTTIDTEYQPFIDSSLLLSPKGDIPEQNTEQNTQEMPNILSGIKSRGFSIFSGTVDDTSNQDPSDGNEENFNFYFGSKKPKGGFFNIFK